MERLAIIDHDRHKLYIEDIDEDVLAELGGDEQKYIDENYNLENYSWDYIVDTEYIPEDMGNGMSYEVNFEEWF